VRQCPDALWRQRQGPGVELPDAWWLMSGGGGLQCGSIGVDGWLAIGEEARAASKQRIGRSSLFFLLGPIQLVGRESPKLSLFALKYHL